jgi:cyanate lyase
MTRDEATRQIVAARQEKSLSWRELAERVGRHPIWTTAALLGQHAMSADEALAATAALDLGPDVAAALQECPMRCATDQPVPTDPTIYRLYELVSVYGPTIKALIHEEFGDGIMSAIDFSMDLKRVEDPKGDRVLLTLNGKFLPYKKF